MKISVALLVVALCASVASATTVYQESFESGLAGYTLSGSPAPATSTDQAHDGSYSMKTTTSGNRAYKALSSAVTDAFTFDMWLYDGVGARAFGQITSYSTWGSGLQQIFAIGKYSSTDLNTGGGAEVYQGTKYQARITNGVAGIVGGSWFNLGDAVSRSTGWHKFTITTALDYSSVSFYVDDVLGRTINLGSTGKPAQGFTYMSYGLGAGSTVENFYYDDVSLNTIPEPVTLVLLGLGGLFLRRRTVR